jgi:hypothetical protein
MPRFDSFLTELVDAAAAHVIATVPDAPYFYDPTGKAYPTGKLGIYRDKTPEIDTPSVTVSAYEVTENVDTLVAIQFKICSKDPREGDAITADLRACFSHLWAKTLGGVKVGYVERTSGSTLPQDARGRGVRTENYQFRVNWPNLNSPA